MVKTNVSRAPGSLTQGVAVPLESTTLIGGLRTIQEITVCQIARQWPHSTSGPEGMPNAIHLEKSPFEGGILYHMLCRTPSSILAHWSL